jgi:hypothetical protein
LVSRSLLNVSERRGINNVADDETLNRLILGNGLSRGHTAHALDMAAAVLVSSVITSLDSHSDLTIYNYIDGEWNK